MWRVFIGKVLLNGTLIIVGQTVIDFLRWNVVLVYFVKDVWEDLI